MRIGILSGEDFPGIESWPVSVEDISETAPKGAEVVLVDIKGKAKLDDDYTLIINPFGSAFPAALWPQIEAYLGGGGNFLNIGGRPFAVPVRKKGKKWERAFETTEFHQSLGIYQAIPAREGDVEKYVSPHRGPAILGELAETFSAFKSWCLYHRETSERNRPDEAGSAGDREAKLFPMLHGVDCGGRRISAPIVCIDHYAGAFKGGRWVLANCEIDTFPKAKELLKLLVLWGLLKPERVEIAPGFAAYFKNETPSLKISCHSEKIEKKKLKLKVSRDNKVVHEAEIALSEAETEVDIPVKLASGFYTVTGEVSPAAYTQPEPTGFWCRGRNISSKNNRITTDGDYLKLDEMNILASGSTYMDSDVQRAFLWEPNPKRWLDDIMEMKAAGRLNIIRTGIWTRFCDLLDSSGKPNEKALRSIDAFILSAAEADIPVIFTLFSFIPPAGSGVNSYLDPDSLKWQAMYIRAIVSRYRDYSGIIWDIINEPSVMNPDHLFAIHPNYDKYEKRAWKDFLKSQGRDLKTALPEPAYFSDTHVKNGRKPEVVTDYIYFTQDVFKSWLKQMYEIIRTEGCSHLIMIGQDEGAVTGRPTPAFFRNHVDLTANHPWWRNHQQPYTNLMCRIPGKPMLAQEVGVMFEERLDGTPAGTEEDRRLLLERKYAYALGSGAAGNIQWLWHTNNLMPDNNEISIGAVRADGTEKPEAETIRLMGAFGSMIGPQLRSAERNEIGILVSFADQFSSRSSGFIPAQRALHVLSRYNGLHPLLVHEQDLKDMKNLKWLLVPSSQHLSDKAWNDLLKLAESGATVVISGPVECDEQGRRRDRVLPLVPGLELVPLARYETVNVECEYLDLEYPQRITETSQRYRLATDFRGSSIFHPHGDGQLIICTHPLELSERVDLISNAYFYFLAKCGIHSALEFEKPCPDCWVAPLYMPGGTLYSIVSEAGYISRIEFCDLGAKNDISLESAPGRATLLWVDREGMLSGAYCHGPVLVNNRGYEPNGDLVFHADGKTIRFCPGRRIADLWSMDEREIPIDPARLWQLQTEDK